MKTINLKEIVDGLRKKRGMTKGEIAAQLFPSNKFPVMAMDRVIKGETYLDELQISKLSLLSGIPIEGLFDNWKMKSVRNIHRLSYKDYHAVIDTDEMIVKLYHNGSLFHEEIICDSKITFCELTELLNIQIKNYESN